MSLAPIIDNTMDTVGENTTYTTAEKGMAPTNIPVNDETAKTFVQSYRFLQAFLECNDEIQSLVKQLMEEVVLNPESSQEDLEMAISSIADALFPNPYKGVHGMGLQESESDAALVDEELSEIVRRMDEEEATFSERVRILMDEVGLTQVELAELIGIGQSAVANILSRNSRPQRRTVEKIANALGVKAQDLWPSC